MCHNPNQSLQKDNLHQSTNLRGTQNRSLVQVASETVFYDDFARQFYDEGHSEEEDRFLLLGVSNTSRILLICHCESESKDVLRIISARKATAKERQLYEGQRHEKRIRFIKNEISSQSLRGKAQKTSNNSNGR